MDKKKSKKTPVRQPKKIDESTTFKNINDNMDGKVIENVIEPPKPGTAAVNTTKRQEKALSPAEKKHIKKQQAQKMKIEKEKQNAKKRVEKARLLEEKKLEKNKKIASMKEQREKKQAEIDNKRAQNERLKKQQAATKAKLKEEKKKNTESGKKASNGGWLAAVIALGVSVLALGSMLTVMFVRQGDTNNLVEQNYQQSFYDLVSYVENMDLNLSKLRVTTGESEQQNYLTNVVVQSELAVARMQQLPIETENKIETASFLNTIGDYSRSLINKVGGGEKLSEEDKKNIEDIYQVVKGLREELSDMPTNLGANYKFMTMLSAKENDKILNRFSDLENHSVEYPKLIYDGPFSENLEKTDPKVLKGQAEINKDEARTKLDEYFDGFDVVDVKYDGETSGKEFTTHNFVMHLKDGETLYAQITKMGGYLSLFDMRGDCKTQNFDKDTCVEIAEKFLEKVGFQDMRAVWINESSNIATINFAYEIDGVIVYSDLIKVKVCEEMGKVIGLESRSYLLNHTKDRTISAPVSIEEARSAVSDKIEILTQRKTIIPKHNGKEVVAYEFMGKYDDSVYYVYISAETGKQTETFKVIESTEGMLLM